MLTRNLNGCASSLLRIIFASLRGALCSAILVAYLASRVTRLLAWLIFLTRIAQKRRTPARASFCMLALVTFLARIT